MEIKLPRKHLEHSVTVGRRRWEGGFFHDASKEAPRNRLKRLLLPTALQMGRTTLRFRTYLDHLQRS